MKPLNHDHGHAGKPGRVDSEHNRLMAKLHNNTWCTADPQGNPIRVFPRGNAWYVTYKGDTYSFMSTTEANRFAIRAEKFQQHYPNKRMRRFGSG